MSLDLDLVIEVDTGGPEKKVIQLYDTNITHNLGVMASQAGIYDLLWRPEEIGIEKAEGVIEGLTEGLNLLKKYPDFFSQFDAENGWGTYKDFVPFVEQYLKACIENPKATIRASR